MQPSAHATQQRIEQRRAVQRGSLSLFTGFLIVFLLALGFVKLTREVVENETLGVDRSIALAVHALATPTLTTLMVIITDLGDQALLLFIPVSLILGLWIWWHARPHSYERVLALLDAFLPAFATLGALILSEAFKLLISRPRPDFFPPLANEQGPSFPSGHMLLSVAFYGSCAYLLGRHAPLIRRLALYLLAVVIVLAVGFSRIYLGVHYPSDVLGSTLLGAAWLISIFNTYDVVAEHLHAAEAASKAQQNPTPASNTPNTISA